MVSPLRHCEPCWLSRASAFLARIETKGRSNLRSQIGDCFTRLVETQASRPTLVRNDKGIESIARQTLGYNLADMTSEARRKAAVRTSDYSPDALRGAVPRTSEARRKAAVWV